MQLLAASTANVSVQEAWVKAAPRVTAETTNRHDWTLVELSELVVSSLHRTAELEKANFGVFSSVSFFRVGGIPRGFPPVLPVYAKAFNFGADARAGAQDAAAPFSHLRPISSAADIGFTVTMSVAATKLKEALRTVDDEVLRPPGTPKEAQSRKALLAGRLRSLSNSILSIATDGQRMSHPVYSLRVAPQVLLGAGDIEVAYPDLAECGSTVRFALDSNFGDFERQLPYAMTVDLPIGVAPRTELLKRALGLGNESSTSSAVETFNRNEAADLARHCIAGCAPPMSALRLYFSIAALDETVGIELLTTFAIRSPKTMCVLNRATVRAFCAISTMKMAAEKLKIPMHADGFPACITPLMIAVANFTLVPNSRTADALALNWGAHPVGPPTQPLAFRATLKKGIEAKKHTADEPFDLAKVVSGGIKGCKPGDLKAWTFWVDCLRWDPTARIAIESSPTPFNAFGAAEQAVALGAHNGRLLAFHAWIAEMRSGAVAAPATCDHATTLRTSATTVIDFLGRGFADASRVSLRHVGWSALCIWLRALDVGSWLPSASSATQESVLDAAAFAAGTDVARSACGTIILRQHTAAEGRRVHSACLCGVAGVATSVRLVVTASSAYLAAAAHLSDFDNPALQPPTAGSLPSDLALLVGLAEERRKLAVAACAAA